MVEDIPSQAHTSAPYRYQHLGDTLETIRDLGLSEENIVGIMRFLQGRGQTDDPELYLKKPFDPKPQYAPQTRFSDGTFPVYYSAVEAETALSETKYHLPSVLGRTAARTAYYREINCDFRGTVKDLRDHVQRLPFLIEDEQQGGYDRCNEVAKEAIAQRLDGLLTRSARRKDGLCLPVFSLTALSNSRPGRLVALSYDPTTNHFTVRAADTPSRGSRA